MRRPFAATVSALKLTLLWAVMLATLAGCQQTQGPKEEKPGPAPVRKAAQAGDAARERQLRRELAERLAALAKKPDDAEANHRVAFKYHQLQDFANARKHWNATLAADPDFAKAHFNLADIDFREGKRDAAVERWKKVLALDTPDAHNLHPSAHYNLARVDYDKGIAFADQHKRDEADNAFRSAVEKYQKALDLNPDHHKACVNLGLALIELHRDKEAAAIWRKTLLRNPQSFHANHNLGLLLASAGDYKEALVYCDAAVESPECETLSAKVQAGAYYTLGELYFDLGDMDESIDAFKESIELDDSLDNAARQRLRAVMRRKTYRR